MVEVICDTNFLIYLATERIKNISNLDVEIGQITFVVPQVVVHELEKLKQEPTKQQKATFTLEYVKKLKVIDINGNFADDVILEYAAKNQCIVATLDKELKLKIKNLGGSILSLSNNKIVLES